MTSKRSGFVVLFFLTSLLFGCGLNSNLMFKIPKGERAITDSIPMIPESEYKISINDKISFKIGPNNGGKIIEAASGLNGTPASDATEYTVRANGKVELPVVGSVMAKDLTIEQFEDTLIELFSTQYKDPFVQVQVEVTNKRVIIFPGGGGDAQVIQLTDANMTLMEVIAAAGGIAERGKASSVKLIRKYGEERKIYQMDLSTVEGLKYVDMIVQADDYIYIEPSDDLAKELVKEVAPVLAILSNLLILVTLLTK
jgi:polysaccharide export outer membrane protein